ncbi:hypothetical protein GCM10009583_14220 [Ornithinicoccus hortensis]
MAPSLPDAYWFLQALSGTGSGGDTHDENGLRRAVAKPTVDLVRRRTPPMRTHGPTGLSPRRVLTTAQPAHDIPTDQSNRE